MLSSGTWLGDAAVSVASRKLEAAATALIWWFHKVVTASAVRAWLRDGGHRASVDLDSSFVACSLPLCACACACLWWTLESFVHADDLSVNVADNRDQKNTVITNGDADCRLIIYSSALTRTWVDDGLINKLCKNINEIKSDTTWHLWLMTYESCIPK